MTSYVIDFILIAALVVVGWRTGAMYRELRALRQESSSFARALKASDLSINKAAHAVVMLRSEGVDTLRALEKATGEARDLAQWLHEAMETPLARQASPARPACVETSAIPAEAAPAPAPSAPSSRPQRPFGRVGTGAERLAAAGFRTVEPIAVASLETSDRAGAAPAIKLDRSIVPPIVKPERSFAKRLESRLAPATAANR
ncbi:hypothetical protein [Aurantimonas sp. Leaf443]|uniref:hypothetical protein n=1 Tax=Aurantimonas sp. Leaf443 TaxID=1736378 RepID=UPI0006F32BFF|nr:hypothetical protein [Aurantimonas sp. Leaf443]